jgi:hypothetical protein
LLFSRSIILLCCGEDNEAELNWNGNGTKGTWWEKGWCGLTRDQEIGTNYLEIEDYTSTWPIRECSEWCEKKHTRKIKKYYAKELSTVRK